MIIVYSMRFNSSVRPSFHQPTCPRNLTFRPSDVFTTPWSSCLPRLSDTIIFKFAKALARPMTYQWRRRILKNNSRHTVVINAGSRLLDEMSLRRLVIFKRRVLDDVTQSAADLFNDDPMDFDGDYADVQGPQPRNRMDKNEICEVRLYNTWQDLVPSQGN
jgi:hypothetical protein